MFGLQNVLKGVILSVYPQFAPLKWRLGLVGIKNVFFFLPEGSTETVAL